MKALVILSGGMDSATVLHWAKANAEKVHAVTFAYGSKHNGKEIPCAMQLTSRLAVPHQVVKLPLVDVVGGASSSLLAASGEAIPEGHYAADNMAKTVVPFRNGVMLAMAAAYAEAHGLDTILLGSHAGDHAVYPDCRYEFTQAMNLAVHLGTGGKVTFEAPFNRLTKGDIVSQGIKLGVPYEVTWSCYVGGERPCGKCGTCVERTEAFLDAGVPDPLMSEGEWATAVDYYRQAKIEHEQRMAMRG